MMMTKSEGAAVETEVIIVKGLGSDTGKEIETDAATTTNIGATGAVVKAGATVTATGTIGTREESGMSSMMSANKNDWKEKGKMTGLKTKLPSETVPTANGGTVLVTVANLVMRMKNVHGMVETEIDVIAVAITMTIITLQTGVVPQGVLQLISS
jgi:hypothetical protein